MGMTSFGLVKVEKQNYQFRGIPSFCEGATHPIYSQLQNLTQSFLKQAPSRSETRKPILELL
jgi:hypothetical protein